MKTTQEIFDKNYNRLVEHGKSVEYATERALVNCYDAVAVSQAVEHWDNKEIEAKWLVVKAREQKADEEIAMVSAERERDEYVKTAVIGYHKIGEPFSVNFKTGKRMMVAVESKGCYGCAFCGITGYIDIRPIYGCRLKGDKHCVCSPTFVAKNKIELTMREDGKNVIYKFV